MDGPAAAAAGGGALAIGSAAFKSTKSANAFCSVTPAV
jgi:hypothetical protein